MKKIGTISWVCVLVLLLTNKTFAQVNILTGILKQKTVNSYNQEAQKEKLKKTPLTVFSDRDDNIIYEQPFRSKIKSKIGLAKAMYVIGQNKIYYEVIVADEKIIGAPKGPLAYIQNKRFHFADLKKVKYLGWIKKENVIEYSKPLQNQKNLKYVKYMLACNRIENLFASEPVIAKEEAILKANPNLEADSKNKLKLNDFIYVFKINPSNKSAFVANTTNLMTKDSLSLKSGWISLNYITPLEDNLVVKLGKKDSLILASKNISFVGGELYKSTFFIPETQFIKAPVLEKKHDIVIPLNIWNHDKNKITSIKGSDISMSTVSQIEEQNKKINLFYIFDNTLANKQALQKILASLQNIKVLINKTPFAGYSFTFSFIAKDKKSFYLLKSDSFSKWLDLIEKSIKNPSEIDTEYIFDNKITVNQWLSEKVSFENNFFIVVGANSSIYTLLPDNLNKMVINSSKLLLIALENKNTPESQDFIFQNKSYLNSASDQNKKFIQNYLVEQKLLTENDEFAPSGEYDNAYIFNAPLKSNFNGGIIFPKLNKDINPKSINAAIDSILHNTVKSNDLILKSLKEYKQEFSFLRSEPSDKLTELIKKSAISDTITSKEIPKNYKKEFLIYHANDSLKSTFDNKLCLLMNKDEIKELIENYQELVSKDYIEEIVDKITVRDFKHKVKLYVKNQKATTKIKRKNTLADLFFNKTGVYVNNLKLYDIQIKDVRKMKNNIKDFKALFLDLNTKLDKLKKMQKEDTFEIFNEDVEVKYYYVPKQLLL